jgi:hypothetical protein
MHLHREAFQRVGSIVRTNGRLPESYFWEYLRDTCAVTQAVAIRRQAEQGPRVCSLGRLLREISEDSNRVTALEPRRGRGGTVDVQPDRVVLHRVLRGVQRFVAEERRVLAGVLAETTEAAAVRGCRGVSRGGCSG